MWILRKLLKLLLLPIFLMLVFIRSFIEIIVNLSSVVTVFMIFLVGFGIIYSIYVKRYSDIIIFSIVGMGVMGILFIAAMAEDLCETLAEKIGKL